MSESAPMIRWKRKAGLIIARFEGNMISEPRHAAKVLLELKKLPRCVGGKVLLSLADIEFLSTVGISTLLSFHKELCSINSQLVVCDLKPVVLQTLRAVGLDNVLGFYVSQAEAIAAFEGASGNGKTPGEADKAPEE